MNTATRCNAEARSLLSAPRRTAGLRNKIKDQLPARVRELSYGPRGCFESVARVTHELGVEIRYSDTVGRLKVVGMYRLDSTVALLVCASSQNRVALTSEFRGYGIGAASRVVMLRRYAGADPRWVEVRVKAASLGEAIETTTRLGEVVQETGGADGAGGAGGELGATC